VLKKYLITMQQPRGVRTRYTVEGTSTFGVIIKVMNQLDKDVPFNSTDTYLACRPATAEDVKLYGEWLI
jgi:hypothetical protein